MDPQFLLCPLTMLVPYILFFERFHNVDYRASDSRPDLYLLPEFFSSKEGCNLGHGLSAALKLGTPEPNDLQPVKQNVCLSPDQEMV